MQSEYLLPKFGSSLETVYSLKLCPLRGGPLYFTISLVLIKTHLTCSETCLVRSLSQETICFEGLHIPGRRSSMKLNLSPDHRSLKTTFLWPMGWSFKRFHCTGSPQFFILCVYPTYSKTISYIGKLFLI